MIRVVAIYGSPRRRGNTALLLREAVKGARAEGAQVEELILRDLKLSPCMATYGCRHGGDCVIRDDFQRVQELILDSQGVMLASPIFFYAVSAHTKIFMDRCHSFWVRQHASEEKDEVRASGVERRREMQAAGTRRKGLFIAVGATRGKRLFEGALLTVRYFFEAIDTERWKSLLYRGIDEEGAILEHPEHLRETYETGRDLVRAIEPTR